MTLVRFSLGIVLVLVTSLPISAAAPPSLVILAETETEREGLPVYDVAGQAELAADFTHFILEQLAKWLNQLKLQVLGKPAHIVVRFDRR